MVQAGRPHRLRLPGSPPQAGSLRVADDELLTVAQSADNPAALVITGQKPGTCFLAGRRADGAELGVLVVISRPYLRLTPKVGEVVDLRLPDGRKVVELRYRKGRRLVALEMIVVGQPLHRPTEADTDWLRWPNGADRFTVKPTGEGVNTFPVTDDRGAGVAGQRGRRGDEAVRGGSGRAGGVGPPVAGGGASVPRPQGADAPRSPGLRR